MQEIMAMVIVATLSYATYKLFELFARRKERMAMIEKLSAGIDPQILKNQFSPVRIPIIRDFINNSWSIRIGMLLLGVGLGVVVATIVDLTVVAPTGSNDNLYYDFRRTVDILYPACAAVFGGIGLIIAYFIEKKDAKKNSSKLED
ncbi:MAG: DUF6249 domain-containing protein [Dysgonomonas sp.]